MLSGALRFVICCALLVQIDFKQYPGSRLDEQAKCATTAFSKDLDCTVYTTGDSFEKVYSFYKALYPEVSIPIPVQKLPNGQEVKWAFFILDGAKDLARSKSWLKVQRPFIGSIADGGRGDFRDIRDVSAIQTIHRR